jgi:hypothetical protein
VPELGQSKDAVAFTAETRLEADLSIGIRSIDHRRIVVDGGELDRRVALDKRAFKAEGAVVNRGLDATTCPSATPTTSGRCICSTSSPTE